MSNQNPVLAIALFESTVHAARIVSGKVEAYREAILDDKAAVEALLNEVVPGWQSAPGLVFSLAPDRSYFQVSSSDEARQNRSRDSIVALAKGQPHGLTAPLRTIACSAQDGSFVASKSDARWVSVTAEEASWSKAAELFPAPLPALAKTGVADLASLGALSTFADSGSVLVLDLGVATGTLFVVGKKGIEGAASIPVGIDTVYEAVQAELGLKFKGSAARLFHNAQYDFSEFGPKIAARVASSIKDASKRLPAATAFTTINLLSGQAWFAKELAVALGLSPWSIEPTTAAARLKLELPSDFTAQSLTPALLGLLHAAAGNKSWVANWEVGIEEPASAVPAAAAPAKKEEPKPAAAAPAPVKKEEAPKPLAPAPKPPPAKPVPAAAPVKKEEPKQAAPTPAKPEPKKEEPKPVAAAPVKKEEPKPAAAAAAPKSEPKKSEPKPAPAPIAEEQPKKKGGLGMIIGVAALAVLLIGGYFVYDNMNAQREQDRIERERIEKASAEKDRIAKENAAKAKAEIESLRKQAEADREAALIKARQETEAAMAKVRDEEKRRFITESPGILLVTSDPTGALVSINDGEPVRTPVTRTDLKPGQYKIKVFLPGYDEFESTAEITALKTTDLGLIKLNRQTGDLAVSSTPAGLEYIVTLNGEVKYQGKTPAMLASIPWGDYSVSIQRPGWPRQTREISVKRDSSEQVSAEFVTGNVVIQSSPSGADVVRNGVKLGITPLRLNELIPGKLELALELKGFDSTPLAGDIIPGKEVVLRAEMRDPNRVAKRYEVQQQPQAIAQELPKYLPPPGSGEVRALISAIIRRDGRITNVKIESGDPEFASACIDAVRQWRFRPGMDSTGRVLNVRVHIPFTAKPPPATTIPSAF